MDAAAANDDDPQSPTTSSPRSGPTSAAVTVAATPHPRTLTLALPIQHHSPASASAASNPNNGGGREDCWSEGATSALIDAWGERYLDLGRGNLKLKHWQEVADAVSARDDCTKPPKSDVQCKNRVDTLKKKYKSEKSKIAAGQSHTSAWPFFHRLDILIGPNFLKPAASAPPPAFPPQFPQKTRTQTVVNHTSSVKKRSTPAAAAAVQEDSGVLPPEEGDGVGVRELTRAILRFGEVYERVERAKVQQMAEVEKQRMVFAGELELQRMQFFVKTQMELSHLDMRPRKRSREAVGGGSENNHRRRLDHHRRHHQNAADNGSNSE